uniref:Uncharacterized protein n=1 Tax=Arundo donax TaxID=35708 RepID=A0A0A9A1I5_ARUDO
MLPPFYVQEIFPLTLDQLFN